MPRRRMRRRRRACRTRATCTGTSCGAPGASRKRSRNSKPPTSCSATTWRKEKIAAEFDWHHAHNLDLLAASYQYVGQMRRAEGAAEAGVRVAVQPAGAGGQQARLSGVSGGHEAVSRKRVAAAKTLTAHPHPVAQAAGHIEMGFALLAMNRFAEGANASNAALRALKVAPDGQALAVIPLEALAGEFRLRTAQREQGRQDMERAAQKWRSLPGPDAWTQSLFRHRGPRPVGPPGRRLALRGPNGPADARARPGLRRHPLRARPWSPSTTATRRRPAGSSIWP